MPSGDTLQPTRARARRRRSRLLPVVLLLAVALVAAIAIARQQAGNLTPVNGYVIDSDDRTLTVNDDGCVRDGRLSVEESAARVRVEVRIEGGGSDGDELSVCRDVPAGGSTATTTLEAPLRSRPVVDRDGRALLRR